MLQKPGSDTKMSASETSHQLWAWLTGLVAIRPDTDHAMASEHASALLSRELEVFGYENELLCAFIQMIATLDQPHLHMYLHNLKVLAATDPRDDLIVLPDVLPHRSLFGVQQTLYTAIKHELLLRQYLGMLLQKQYEDALLQKQYEDSLRHEHWLQRQLQEKQYTKMLLQRQHEERVQQQLQERQHEEMLQMKQQEQAMHRKKVLHKRLDEDWRQRQRENWLHRQQRHGINGPWPAPLSRYQAYHGFT